MSYMGAPGWLGLWSVRLNLSSGLDPQGREFEPHVGLHAGHPSLHEGQDGGDLARQYCL